MGSTRSIHLSLVNGRDGRQLKSMQLTIDANKLFVAQTQIRQQVLTMLGWQIPPVLKQQFTAYKPAFDGAYKHYLQGQGYLYRFDHGDNITKALESFRAAIALDIKYADAYVGLAEAQLRSFIESKDGNLLNEMKKTVEQLKQIDGHHRLLSYLQAELKLNQGDYLNAVQLFEKSIQQQPTFLRAYTSISDSHIELGQFDKAEKILLNAYKIMPNNNTVLAKLGLINFRDGDYYRAIEFWELLARQAPNNYIAYLNISACHYLNGDIEKAIFSAQQSLAIQPNADVYSNLGTYYFILNYYDKAVEAYEQMIALNSLDYIKWGNLADAYRFAESEKYLGAFNQAITLAEKAIGLNPNNKEAIALLAYYNANVENVDNALLYAKKINKSDLGENQYFIAAAYTRLGMNATAIKYLEYAINNSYSIAEITNSPLFDNLKKEPEYLQLLTIEYK
jgi:serine/threonine-protein kinase